MLTFCTPHARVTFCGALAVVVTASIDKLFGTGV